MYLSSWQSLLMVATIPNIIVIIAGLFSYIPESIRWQVCKGKPYRVLETVQKMAKVNSVEFSVSTYNLIFFGPSTKEGDQENDMCNSVMTVVKFHNEAGVIQ